MLEERNNTKSVMALARGLLQTPPAGSGLAAFTVYSEKNVREVMQKTLTPVRPCVFLVDSYMRPGEPVLPMIVVELPLVKRKPFELGNHKGRWVDAIYHVFGRNKGDRDDLASFLANNIGGQIPLYDYTSSASGVFVHYATVHDEIDIEPVPLTRIDLRWEGSLDSWAMVSFSFLSKN